MTDTTVLRWRPVHGALLGAVYVLLAFAAPGVSSADTALNSAVQLLERGEYTMAASRLAALIEKDPGTPSANEAYYHLGRSYEAMGALQQAVEGYAEYLVRVPGGAYETEALTSFRKLQAELLRQFPSHEVSEQKLAELESAYDAHPENSVAGLELADALWRLGRYERSAEVYSALYAVYPAVANEVDFSRRIEIGPDGEFTLLTPEEQMRRQRENTPIAVFNTASYAGGRSRKTQALEWYIVAGEVLNQSERRVDGVEVITTIYAFGRQVYDTHTERIGSLAPGETRAFSARFTRFENINNVDRYECTVRFK